MFSMVICFAWIAKRSLNDSLAKFTLGSRLVNLQLAINFLSAPSSSLTFVRILLAIKKATSSGRSKPSSDAFTFNIATHVSSSGGSIQTVSPQPNLDLSLSSSPRISLG